MTGRSVSVEYVTHATVSRVSGLFRHHPETTIAAVLALAYPARSAAVTPRLLVIGHVDGLGDDARVSIEWDLSGPTSSFRFSGSLEVVAEGAGARLRLEGVEVSEDATGDAALSRFLSWMARAAEAGLNSSDT